MTEDKNKASRSRTVLLLLFIFPGIVATYLLFMTFTGPPPKPVLPYYGINNADTLQLPDFDFTDQLNQSISRQAFQDKIKIIHFFNTTCIDGCVEVVRNLVNVQDYFKEGEDVQLLSFTTDVSNDQPAAIKKFGELHETNNRQWAFVTVSSKVQENSYAQFIQHPFFNLQEAKALNLSVHQKIILVDKKGTIRGYYDGLNKTQTQQLQEHIEILKLEYGTQEKYR